MKLRKMRVKGHPNNESKFQLNKYYLSDKIEKSNLSQPDDVLHLLMNNCTDMTENNRRQSEYK